MRKERKHYTAEEKVAILRRRLLDKVPVSDLCEELGLQPTVFYRWQKEFFENGAAAFQTTERLRDTDGAEPVIENRNSLRPASWQWLPLLTPRCAFDPILQTLAWPTRDRPPSSKDGQYDSEGCRPYRPQAPALALQWLAECDLSRHILCQAKHARVQPIPVLRSVLF